MTRVGQDASKIQEFGVVDGLRRGHEKLRLAADPSSVFAAVDFDEEAELGP